MKTTSIKQCSESLWKEGDYQECFNKAIELPVLDFISFIRDNKSTQKNFLKGRSGHHFWKLWILETPKFNDIFSLPESADLLLEYFISHNINSEFLIRIAQHNPQLFIDALRTNQVFLKDYHWPTILEIREALPANVVLWVSFLDNIRSLEKTLWKEVDELWHLWKDIEPIEVITYAALWYEKYKIDFSRSSFEDKESLFLMHELCKSISTFLAIYFQHAPKSKFADEISILESQLEILSEIEKREQNPIFQTLDKIRHWVNFEDKVISIVSYDSNFELRETVNAWYLSPKSILEYIKWQSEENKYLAIELSYLEVAVLVKKRIEDGTLNIPGNNKDTKNYNELLSIQLQACFLLLKDMNLESINDVPILVVARLLHVAQTNAYVRYVEQNHNWRKNNNWIVAIVKHFSQDMLDKHICSLPVRIETVEEWKEKAKEFCSLDGTNYCNEILELLSFAPNRKHKFDRFKIKFNCQLTPFLRVGNDVVSFPGILGESNPTHNLVELSLNMYRDKRETAKMEESLAGKLKDAGFRFVLNSIEFKYEEGRVELDILAFDGKTLLIIELKRTKPKMDLRSRRLEEKLVTGKAVEQLDKAIGFLISYPTFLRKCFCDHSLPLISEIKIETLILSTSPESTGRYYGRHYKAFYQEFLLLLNPFFTDLSKYESLALLVERIKTGVISKEVAYPFRNNGDLELSFAKNPEVVEMNLRQKGIYCYSEKVFLRALNYYESALEIDPSSVWLLESIGNCYSKLKNFEKSIEYYSRALVVSPNDWHILLNRSMSYRDLGWHNEEFHDLLTIMQWYGDFNARFSIELQNRTQQLFDTGKLNADSIQKLINIGFFNKQ